MSNKNKSSSCYVREYDGFEGIDRARRSGGLTDVVNLRLANDKTLKKREAAKKLTSLSSSPRAHYVYDNDNLLLLTGNRVFLLNITTLAHKDLGFTETYVGAAQFFCYDGKILLLDGNKIYICDAGGVSELDGYAPLYGKNWDPLKKGSINQQMNLLSRHYRISYLIEADNPSLFLLDVATKSVDAAYVNGARVNQSRFSVDDGGFSLTCSLEIKSGSVLTLYMSTASPVYSSNAISSCKRAATYGDGNARGADVSSIVFYGGNESASVFCTRRIDRSDFEAAKREYSSALSIYVTSEDRIVAGNGSSPITAVCRRGGNLLVFTHASALVLKETERSSNLLNLSDAGGCSSPEGAAPMGDTPITVSAAGILKWSPIKYDSEEYVAKCISIPISGLPHPDFYLSSVVFPCRKKNEIWFTDPHSDDKRIFIYSYLLDCWYSFSGISADSFFEIGSRLGFISGMDVFIFDDMAGEDSNGDSTTPIVTKLSTGRVTFGDFDCKKRLCKFSLLTAPQNFFEVSVTDAEGESQIYSVSDNSGEELGYIEKRTSSRRSRYYSLTVTGRSKAPVSICGMTLTAAK